MRQAQTITYAKVLDANMKLNHLASMKIQFKESDRENDRLGSSVRMRNLKFDGPHKVDTYASVKQKNSYFTIIEVRITLKIMALTGKQFIFLLYFLIYYCTIFICFYFFSYLEIKFNYIFKIFDYIYI